MRFVLIIPLSTGWYGKKRAGVLRRTIGGGPRLRVDFLLFHSILVRANQSLLRFDGYRQRARRAGRILGCAGCRQYAAKWKAPACGRLQKLASLERLKTLDFHDLRHTAATRMAETGAEPSTIKDILGHSYSRMTDRYTHAVAARKRMALERIAGYGKTAEVIHFEERKIR